MRKHLMAALLAIVMCLAALSGCSLVKGLEKDIQVVLKVNGEYQGCYTVNAFNNAIVPVPEAPQGLMFYGWTADENWEEKGAANVKVSANKGLIRYDDVKDYIVNDELSVTLYPVFGEIPRHDIAIAWYNKAATSGLNEAIIDGFTGELNKFLTDKGYKTEELDIVIRPYAGNVGPTCEAIRGDGDIDIMIGWSNTDNLTGTGGMKAGVDFLENNGNILINPDFEKGARYTARLSDTEMCNLVYDWILETYAGEGGPKLDYLYDGSAEPEPEPEPEPQPPVTDKITLSDTVLNVSVWNNRNKEWMDTSKLSELERDFKVFLAERATNADAVTINWTDEVAVYLQNETEADEKQPNVAALVAAVKAAGNIDFVLACGNNVNSSGNLENLEKADISGEKATAYAIKSDRKAAILNKDNPNELSVLLFEFLTGKVYKPELTSVSLNVSVWNNRNKEWMDTTKLAELERDFKTFLGTKYSNADAVTVNWTDEVAVYLQNETEPDEKQPNVAALVASVKAAGNIDFVLACGNNVNSSGNLVKADVAGTRATAYGIKSDRKVAVLNKDNPNKLSVLLYEFLTNTVFTAEAA